MYWYSCLTRLLKAVSLLVRAGRLKQMASAQLERDRQDRARSAWLVKGASTMSLKSAGRGRIPEVAKEMGDFLENVLPVRAFASLTTRTQISQSEFDYLVNQWVRGMQEHNRLTIAWIKSYEYGVRRHAHVALIAAAPLDCVFAEILWRKLAAPRYRRAAVVKPYSKGACGAGYVIKCLDTPVEEVAFSENLNAFAMGNRKSLFRSTSRQRRQRRRIDAQMKQYSQCVVPPHAKPCSPSIPPEWLVCDHDK